MEKGMKFTLGAALMFEELSGKKMADLGDGLGLKDTVILLYAQKYWNQAERPTLEAFTLEIGANDVHELPALLNAPFFPTEAQ
jgi:hypothetical protein